MIAIVAVANTAWRVRSATQPIGIAQIAVKTPIAGSHAKGRYPACVCVCSRMMPSA
jgi:hypothetical protein